MAWRDEHPARRNDAGAKDVQTPSEEPRVDPYSRFRREMGPGVYCSDVDFIEVRYVDQVPTCAAWLEVTRVDHGKEVNDRYLDAVVGRLNTDLQGKLARAAAAALRVPAYVVLFREDVSELWVRNMRETAPSGWNHWLYCTPRRYTQWLRELPVPPGALTC